MKYLVVLADGMADYPVPQLDLMTPMQKSKKPKMDHLAQNGEVGLVNTVPAGFSPGSDVANLSVMGYDPRQYYTGRSPIEAASIGVNLGSEDVAFRCNLVTLSDESHYENSIMVDYSSDEISTIEAHELIKDLAKALNSDDWTFYPGISYRHLLVWHKGPTECALTPPHDISDKSISSYLPSGDRSEVILNLMKKSQQVLNDHPVNKERVSKGLCPATSIWLWGQGKRPKISSFFEKYQLKGSVISAVDLAKGLGICAGLSIIEVPGATGNIHTNFRGKAQAAIDAFRRGEDFVYLHIEAPDEAGHRGEVENKVLSIEKIDQDVLTIILEELPKISPEFRIMVLPDHPTPLALKTHVSDPVPYLIYDHNHPRVSGVNEFCEESAKRTGVFIEDGYRLMDRFLS